MILLPVRETAVQCCPYLSIPSVRDLFHLDTGYISHQRYEDYKHIDQSSAHNHHGWNQTHYIHTLKRKATMIRRHWVNEIPQTKSVIKKIIW